MLLLLIFSLFLLFPNLSFAHSTTQVIEVVENGFKPGSVEVDSETTLIFINKDSKDRWPASNIHPTHDLYPEFDPKKALQPGQSWTFKPQKAGEWKYHDHLLPHLRGSITVVAEDGQVETSSWQQKIREFWEGFLTRLKDIFSLKKNEAEKNWENIKQKYKGQAGSGGDIHDQAHLAGGLIFKEKGFAGIGVCTPEFAFGCYHGFLDTAFKKDLSKLDEALDACKKLGPGINGPVASCIHGIGHGVASFHLSDLKKSLSSCRKLKEGREFCFDGVFMEFVRSAPEEALRKNDPLYPCNELEKEFGPIYSTACGRNQPPLLMGRLKVAFDEVVKVCLHPSTTQPFKEACVDALGFGLAASGDEKQIIQGCGKIGFPEFTIRCITAAAGEMVFQEVPDWETKSEAICQAIPEGKESCLAHVNRLVKEYGRKTKLNFENLKKGEDLSFYLRKEIKKCFDADGRDGCYKEVADLLYSQFGLKKTLDLFKENENYPEVYARCHEVTHYLSRSEYEKEKSIARVYTQCDSTCHGGCYHGTLEAYLKENQDADFAQICGTKSNYQKPIEYNECLHGLGHAAMFVTDMELQKSLKLCDTLIGEKPRERCLTGVFMENSSSSTSFDHASKYIKKDDPFYPCNSLDEKYQGVCWQYQSSYFSIINNQDWKKVANMCLQIPEKYQDKCFRTIGTNQVGFTQSLTKMKEDCDLMPNSHFKNVCVEGVVSSFAYRFVGDSQKMVDFCNLVDTENKESCFKQMGTGVLDWNSNKNLARKECDKIVDFQNRQYCKV